MATLTKSTGAKSLFAAEENGAGAAVEGGGAGDGGGNDNIMTNSPGGADGSGSSPAGITKMTRVISPKTTERSRVVRSCSSTDNDSVITTGSEMEDPDDLASNPILQEALGVTKKGTCLRHPNCPVLQKNRVMSCRICFSEEKSVGIRQGKSFAAVLQQLQRNKKPADLSMSATCLSMSTASLIMTDSDDEDEEDGGQQQNPQMDLLHQPQTLESIMKRLTQVQNWMLRQKEKEVLSLQLHIHRLEQRLEDTEKQNGEQKTTIRALRRTIQQDLKIIKTMAVQKEREQEEIDALLQQQLQKLSPAALGGQDDTGISPGIRAIMSPHPSSSGAAQQSPADEQHQQQAGTPASAASSTSDGASPGKRGSGTAASPAKMRRAAAAMALGGGADPVGASSGPPEQSGEDEQAAVDDDKSYCSVFVPPQEKASQYWSDADVLTATDPSKLFASLRGGLLDIPQAPPPPQRHDSQRKLQLDTSQIAALKVPRRGLVVSRGSSAMSDISRSNSAVGDMSNLAKMAAIASAQGLLDGSDDGDASGGLEVPMELLADRLNSLPVTRKYSAAKSPGAMSDLSLDLASPEAGQGQQRESSSAEGGPPLAPPFDMGGPPEQLMQRAPPRQFSGSSDDQSNKSGTTPNGSPVSRAMRPCPLGTVIEAMQESAAALDASAALDTLNLFVNNETSTDAAAAAGGSGGDGQTAAAPSTTIKEDQDPSGDTGANNVPKLQPRPAPPPPKGEQKQQSSSEPEKLTFDVTGASSQDKFGDTGMYTGTILVTEGLPHGAGTMNYESGRVYAGNWVSGQWHGKGNLINPNGDTYEGEFAFDSRDGQGLYKWDNGDVYKGSFSQDRRHGQGKFSFHNGNVYEGEFCDGMFEGYGRYEFSDGHYEGEWKKGRYDGSGELAYRTGGKYTGEFRNSVAHGFGMEVTPDGNKKRGVWENGQPAEIYGKEKSQQAKADVV